MLQTVKLHGLGGERVVTYDDGAHVATLDEAIDRKLVAATFGKVGSRIVQPGERWIDTSEKLSLSMLQTIKSRNVDGVVRYVNLASQSPAVGIDAVEFGNALGLGLGVMLVQFSRTTGISAQTGSDDGSAFVARAQQLQCPMVVNMWGDFFPAARATMMAYGDAHFSKMLSLGADQYAPGGYWEPGAPADFDPWADWPGHRYWMCAANGVRYPAPRGACFHQLWPGNILLAQGLVIDYDFADHDWYGGAPVCAVAA